jgi:peptide deformylase
MINELPKGIYQLVTWPDERLTTPSQECTDVDIDELKKMIKPMIAIMREYKGVGLAAVQIGVHKRFCLVLTGGVTPDGAKNENFVAMINPVIVEQGEIKNMQEGCLSLPGFSDVKKRSDEVVVKYRDLEWKEVTVVLNGIEAQCIQHEIQHMEGKPICNDISVMKRQMWEKKLSKGKKYGKVRH